MRKWRTLNQVNIFFPGKVAIVRKKIYDFILLFEGPLSKDSSISTLDTLFNVLDALAAIFELQTPTRTEIL